MEFTGLNGGTCSTRPVAVKGKGRFKVSGAGKFSFSRFFAYEPGAELVLDTDRAGNDVFIGGIADGAAPLDVAKEGSGTIALIGTQSFTGNLTVRSGTLVVCGYKREKYTWFRWTIKETALHCARYTDQFDTTGAEQLKMMMQEFALFDADGRRVNVGHSENRDAKADVTLLSPGEVTIQGNSWPAVGGKLNELYNGVQWESGADWYGMSISSGDFPGYRMSVPASYKYVVERLPTDANEVASYDIAYAYGTNSVNKGGWGITAFSLEGSTDGVHWSAPLVDRSDCVVPYENFRWLSSPDSPLNTHRGKKDSNEVTYFDDHRGFAVDGFCVSGSSNI
jgi:autotransporter-associated beta strand protein